MKHTLGHRKSAMMDLGCALLAGAVTFCVSYLFALRGVDPHHDGIMLKTASDVAAGLTLYKETFTQYGSLVIYVFALFVKLFGVQVTSIHLATCLAYAGCAIALYYLVRRLANPIVGLLSPLLAIGLAPFWFWNFHPWSSVFALLFSLLACLFMSRFIRFGKERSLVLCGMCTAAMFWCRQPAGLTALCGVCMLLGLWAAGFQPFKTILKGLLWFLLGNLLVHGGFLLVILLQGAFSDWWIQAILNAFSFATQPTAETAASLPDSLWKLFFVGVNTNPQYDWLWRVLTYGTLLTFLLSLFFVFRQKKKQGKADPSLLCLLAFCAFNLFNWVHYYPTLCYRHMFWSDYGMVGVLAAGLYRLLRSVFQKIPLERRRSFAVTGGTCLLLALLCASNVLVRVRYGKSRLMGGGTGADFSTQEVAEEDTVLLYNRSDYPYLNGLYLSQREARFYDGLFDGVAKAKAAFPEKNIVNVTPNALFSLFSTDNVHKHAFALFADGYPEQTKIVDDYIQTEKPILISTSLYEGYDVTAYLTDYNGDYFRFQPMYVLAPKEG